MTSAEFVVPPELEQCDVPSRVRGGNTKREKIAEHRSVETLEKWTDQTGDFLSNGRYYPPSRVSGH